VSVSTLLTSKPNERKAPEESDFSISSDNILGASNAQGAQGGNAAGKTSSGSKSSTEDNSQHNGVGTGSLLGLGVDALNWYALRFFFLHCLTKVSSDNILGVSNAQCAQGVRVLRWSEIKADFPSSSEPSRSSHSFAGRTLKCTAH
jgi:hypothetical protein